MAHIGALQHDETEADCEASPAMSHELPSQIADHELAKILVGRMEEHWVRFGLRGAGFSFGNTESLTVVVLQRASRMFWNKHENLWPAFVVTGTGISLQFTRLSRRR